MARKSMIVKSQREPKFEVRKYTRCSRCGRPHGVLRKFGICRIVLENFDIRSPSP